MHSANAGPLGYTELVLQREHAEIGVYISFEEPTKPMQREAAETGFYTSPGVSGQPGSKYPASNSSPSKI